MNLDLVEKAMALKPLLRERARDAEIARQIPRETVDNFIEAGILKNHSTQALRRASNRLGNRAIRHHGIGPR